MRLVNNDGRVAAEEEVFLDLPHEDAIRHELDGGVATQLPVIAHLGDARTTRGSNPESTGGSQVWLT